MLGLLSSNFSGLAIATIIALLGIAFLATARTLSSPLTLFIKGLGLSVLIIALALAGTASYHLVRLAQARAEYPAPGELVDVGGYRMHVLAEGPKDNGPTIVWISGRHDSGFVLHHLHKQMAQARRSIVFDRAGSGWSDTGPFPRTVAVEARELHILLERAGERGPFILVPWSFSGLLATTYAALYPGEVAGLVLLDTTDPATPVFDRNTAIRSMCKTERRYAWLARYGWGWGRFARLPAAQKEQFMSLYAPIADVQQAIIANNAQPRFHLATCSALQSAADHMFNSVQGEGALGELPISVVIPDNYDKAAEDTARRFFSTPFEQENAAEFYRIGKDRLARLSAKSQIRMAPAGSTHSFPFETPQFVIDEVNAMADRTQNNE